MGHTYCVVEGRGGLSMMGNWVERGDWKRVDSAGTICLILRFCVDYHKIFPATRKIVFRSVIFMYNCSINDCYKTL